MKRLLIFLLLLPSALANWTPGELSRTARIEPQVAGGSAITFVSAGTEGAAASGNVSPGFPSGVANGDIVICVWHCSAQTAGNMSGDWTEIVQANGGGTTSRLGVWWHRYSGSTPSLEISSATGGTVSAGMAAFRGCVASGSPVDLAGTIAGGTDSTLEHSAITVSEGTLLLAANGSADDNGRTALGGAWNVAWSDGGNAYVTTFGTPDGSCSLFYKAVTAGATGEIAITQAAADPWAAVLIALKP